ncbi:helicase [Aureococcus anophagefferens]|nr:helicase [Aureococcus anophagefferens]
MPKKDKKERKRKRSEKPLEEETITSSDLINGPPNKQKKSKKHFERRVARDGAAQLEALASETRKDKKKAAAAPAAAAPPPTKPSFELESYWARGPRWRRSAPSSSAQGRGRRRPRPLWRLRRAPQGPAAGGVQRQAWPAALRGLDVLAIAPTGSGKTLAYLLPAIGRVLGGGGPRSRCALVVVPTRELAAQVHLVAKKAEKWAQAELGACVVAGGAGAASRPQQFEALARSSLAVATPGRLLDLARGGAAKRLDAVVCWVVDEADRMLQLGFEEQLDELSRLVPAERQTLLFTATFPQRLRHAADRYVGEPDRVCTIRVNTSGGDDAAPAPAAPAAPERAPGRASASRTRAPPSKPQDEAARRGSSLAKIAKNVTQQVHVCAAHKRPRLLLRFLERFGKEDAAKRQASKVLLFVNTASACAEVVELVKRHYKANTVALLHGKLPQRDRDAALLNFRAGKTNVLVATDVASRGLHVSRLNVVVNWDFPTNLEAYTHRVGRAGRDGEPATALSFFTRNLIPLAPALVALLTGGPGRGPAARRVRGEADQDPRGPPGRGRGRRARARARARRRPGRPVPRGARGAAQE